MTTPDFDGDTYSRQRDHARLEKQWKQVRDLMSDGLWHTLAEMSSRLGFPEASVSARLRDLRKDKFGGRVVERRYVLNGLWEYRLLPLT